MELRADHKVPHCFHPHRGSVRQTRSREGKLGQSLSLKFLAERGIVLFSPYFYSSTLTTTLYWALVFTRENENSQLVTGLLFPQVQRFFLQCTILLPPSPIVDWRGRWISGCCGAWLSCLFLFPSHGSTKTIPSSRNKVGVHFGLPYKRGRRKGVEILALQKW